MAIYTPEELHAGLLQLRTPTNADTLDAVIALLEQYGVLSGLTPEEAAPMIARSAIRVRQLANSGAFDGIRLGSGRGTLLLSAVSVQRLAGTLSTETPYTGRPKNQQHP